MTLFDNEVPELGSYDIILVNTSAGKDSQAMLDLVVREAALVGVTDRIVAVHADLGHTPEGRPVEWPGTAALAEHQANIYGVRFIKVAKSDGGDLLSYVQRRGMWPSSTARYCTSDMKRGPIRTVMTRLAAEQRAAGVTGRRVRILNCMGFRRQESPARRRKVPFVVNGPASNQTVRQVDEWLPILEWDIDEVWATIRASGVPHHPAYDAGMPRLSCVFCVLASGPALVRAAQLMPDLADEYARTEVAIGHRFRQDLSMADIIDRAGADPTPVTIPDWNA